jgi:hypothetical protein
MTKQEQQLSDEIDRLIDRFFDAGISHTEMTAVVLSTGLALFAGTECPGCMRKRLEGLRAHLDDLEARLPPPGAHKH